MIVFAVAVLPTQQWGADGRSISETGATPERHQPPLPGARGEGYFPVRTQGATQAYNGVFNFLTFNSHI